MDASEGCRTDGVEFWIDAVVDGMGDIGVWIVVRGGYPGCRLVESLIVCSNCFISISSGILTTTLVDHMLGLLRYMVW